MLTVGAVGIMQSQPPKGVAARLATGASSYPYAYNCTPPYTFENPADEVKSNGGENIVRLQG